MANMVPRPWLAGMSSAAATISSTSSPTFTGRCSSIWASRSANLRKSFKIRLIRPAAWFAFPTAATESVALWASRRLVSAACKPVSGFFNSWSSRRRNWRCDSSCSRVIFQPTGLSPIQLRLQKAEPILPDRTISKKCRRQCPT